MPKKRGIQRFMNKSKIGLFGGTFNPVHLGHLWAAEIVQKRISLEKVLFIPSYIPPHKETFNMASPLHRLQMVELACAPYPRFIPSSIEIEERGTSYSIYTLKKIKEFFPDALFFFILGIDAFLEIETWKDYEKLIQNCSFIVISRPGYDLDSARGVLVGKYKEKIIDLAGSNVSMEDTLSSFRIFLLPLDALNIASSEIRKRIRNGVSVKDMISDNVEEYIKKHKIYS